MANKLQSKSKPSSKGSSKLTFRCAGRGQAGTAEGQG